MPVIPSNSLCRRIAFGIASICCEARFIDAEPVSALRLKSALWVAAYIRRCQVEGAFAVVSRRGAEEAGAVFVRICRLDGTSDLFSPAPQSAIEIGQGADRSFVPNFADQPVPDATIDSYLAREVKFDTDVWIVEVEEPGGRNFLDIVR